VCWRELGDRMAIRDIPESLEELEAWSLAYEEEHMVPAETNRLVAQYTTAEMIAAIPEAFGLRRFVERCTTCLLEDRVRIAMLCVFILTLGPVSLSGLMRLLVHSQPAQPWYLHAFVKGSLHLLGFVQHYLCLPRRSPSFPAPLDVPRDMTERVHPPV
jgi:hypothetical protein